VSIRRKIIVRVLLANMTKGQKKPIKGETNAPKRPSATKSKTLTTKAKKPSAKIATAKKASATVTSKKASSKVTAKVPAKTKAKSKIAAKSVAKAQTKPSSKNAAPPPTTSKTPTKETVTTLRSHVDGIVKRLKTADTLTRKNVKTLETAFSVLEKQVKEHQTVNHAALAKRVDQLSSHLTQSLDSVKSDISQDLKTALTNPTVGGIEDAIARSESRLIEAESNQARAIARISQHIAELARVIDARLKTQETATQTNAGNIVELENELTSIKSQTYERIRLVEDSAATAVRKIGGDVVGTAEKFQVKLETQSDVLKHRISQIAEQTQQDFDQQNTELSRRMESIEDSQKNQSNYVDRAISKLASRIDSLEYGLSNTPEPSAVPEVDDSGNITVPAINIAAPTALTPTGNLHSEPSDDAFAPPVQEVPAQEAPAQQVPAQQAPARDFSVEESTANPFIVPQDAATPVPTPEPIYSYEPQTDSGIPPNAYTAPQEYQPTGPTPQMAPQHQYVDPVQAAYQASMNSENMQGQAVAYEQYNPVQAPPFPQNQAPDLPAAYSYDPNSAPSAPMSGFSDEELPYSNPGYGEGDTAEGVSRPGHIAEKRPKTKRKRPSFNASSALSSLPITPRNLKVAGLALVLATAGYFGLRGFMGNDGPNPQAPTEQITQNPAGPMIPASNVIVEAPIGQYKDNQVPSIAPGVSTNIDAEPPSESLQAAADKGNPIAQFQLGVSYLDAGRPKQGVKYIRSAANQGQPAAQYRLAKLYEAGIGVAADPDMARQLTERAARAGNRIAMHDLGLYYAEGRGGVERNMDTALSWFEKAAERGVVDSQYNLGVLFESSPEIQRNPASSFVWYSIAASQGDQLAANRVDVIRQELQGDALKNAEDRVNNFKPTAIEEAANGIFRNVTWTLPQKRDIKPAAELVRDAQTLLSQLGYEVGAPDGDMGPKTRNAVKAFEKANGLPETGAISASLVDRLEAAAGV